MDEFINHALTYRPFIYIVNLWIINAVLIIMAKQTSYESEIVHLSRLALSGRHQDVQMFLNRLARQYRETSPDLSQQLSDLLRDAPTRSSPLRGKAESPMPVDTDTRMHLLRIESPPILDNTPVYAENVEKGLRQLLTEQKNPQSLLDANLHPTRTVLFTGPPGVGKTLAARWIARELNRPLLILDLAAVMSSFLGRTGTNLRYVLDYAKQTECVLLLDELDAIAKRRDDREEIGELKRLVTVLIQQIDDWPSSGLLLAATNHPSLLDPAIWRRFELVVDFPYPDKESIGQFVRNFIDQYTDRSVFWAKTLGLALQGRSFSEIEHLLVRARRSAAISGVDLDSTLVTLLRCDGLSKSDRISLAQSLVSEGIMSQRKARELTGVARDTIRQHKKSSSDLKGAAA